jgi:hypothetical protein
MAALPGLVLLACLILTKSRERLPRASRRAPGLGLALAARRPRPGPCSRPASAWGC